MVIYCWARGRGMVGCDRSSKMALICKSILDAVLVLKYSSDDRTSLCKRDINA